MRKPSAPALSVLTLGIFAFGLLVAGCGAPSDDPSDSATAAPEPEVEELAVELDEASQQQLALLLASADAFDGTTDHVVAKCAGCGLGMDGSADHVLHVAEYELHFCSDTCQEHFEEGPEQAVLALVIPE